MIIYQRLKSQILNYQNLQRRDKYSVTVSLARPFFRSICLCLAPNVTSVARSVCLACTNLAQVVNIMFYDSPKPRNTEGYSVA